MFRRRRPLLRAGMLAGTAYAAHQAGERSLERRYAEADQDQRIADLETRGVAPVTAPPAESGLVGELTKLKGLLDAGALTPDEFEAAKRKLLST
jgi:hypothetical protein